MNSQADRTKEDKAMNGLNVLAIIGATVAAVVFSSGWYIALNTQRKRLSAAATAGARPPAWMLPMEILRTVVVALVIAGLVSRLAITNLAGALPFAVALWVAFPVVLLSGSVLYERVPWQLAAIHAGDWLAKLLIITIVVALWR
jgi:hypothetical protein